MSTHLEKAKDFLAISSQFQLGHLTTENFHPLTENLSEVVKVDLEKAFDVLKSVDHQALTLLMDQAEDLWKMCRDIQDTLDSGHKVFMCGCGATGRLSLVLETLYRKKFGPSNQVFSFMAGGDFALIKSVESFEDRTQYGARQLEDLDFGPNDLLLASTEGGETPFVIGATQRAKEISKRKPYFLYCNPDALLESVERSRKVIQAKDIIKVNLTVGPMAISGSTRMQASTVLMLSIGVGLLYKHHVESEFLKFYQKFLKDLMSISYSVMAPLTQSEFKLYENKVYLNYESCPDLAISILTDTTERSPTFSLQGFENVLGPEGPRSLSYLFIPEATDSKMAWQMLLERPPRALDWEELGERINLDKIYGFDISKKGEILRSSKIKTKPFKIHFDRKRLTFSCETTQAIFETGDDLFLNHLVLKMLLNAHSTLLMGLLGRYEGNVMTWVRASNNKLIDRAARYIIHILDHKGISCTYEDVVIKIFECIEGPIDSTPVVLKVVAQFQK